MKKLLLTSAAALVSLSLAGCDTMNNTAGFANSTIGSGVKFTATTVGKGVGVVSHTGAAIGHGVGTVVNTGTGVVTGHSGTYHQTRYHHGNTVYYKGHHYVVKNGKYVRVH